MQLRSEAATADMYARKAEGATIAEIGAIWGLKPMAVYQRLRRSYGGIPRGSDIRELPVAANDNNPDRATRMTAHNGGCSTVSGMMPVSVRRVAEGVDDENAEAGRVVNDYALQVAA